MEVAENTKMMTPEEPEGGYSIKDIGRKGGKSTLKRHGRAHFRRISNKRWEKARVEEDNEKPEDSHNR